MSRAATLGTGSAGTGPLSGATAVRPTWEIAASLGLHVALGALIFLGQCVRPDPAPLIDPSKVMQVQAVALPRSTSSMPDRPSRTPDPPKGADTPDAAPPPPPTASDMVVQQDDAPTPKGADRPQDRTDARQALLNQARREALIKDPNAPLGDVDRTRTDPNGVDPQDAIFGAGTGTMDPELARYISACRTAILPNWTPLPATIQAHPEYQVQLLVPVSSDGKLGEAQLVKGSGDASFDRSALLAVVKTARLPNPPARFRDSAAQGVLITLAARDLQ